MSAIDDGYVDELEKGAWGCRVVVVVTVDSESEREMLESRQEGFA